MMSNDASIVVGSSTFSNVRYERSWMNRFPVDHGGPSAGEYLNDAAFCVQGSSATMVVQVWTLADRANWYPVVRRHHSPSADALLHNPKHMRFFVNMYCFVLPRCGFTRSLY